MNELGKLYDSVAKMEYTLFSMPYLELKKLVLSGLSMTEEEVIRFDTESEYYSKIAVRKKETERPLHVQLGLEQMPFVLSYDSEENRYRLLDGFNRLFGSYGVFEQTVLVKVYQDITQKDWSNIMAHANAWKITNLNVKAMMDRGFKLSLFEHYGIDLTTSPNGNVPLLYPTAFSSYFNRDVFGTMLNHTRLVEDTNLIIQFLSEQLSYHNKTKQVDEWILGENRHMKGYAHSFELLKEEMVFLLGELRRKEISESFVQNEIKLNDLKSFYEQKELQKHFVKVTNMKVPGHTENYIKKHLSELMKEHLSEKLGHLYENSSITVAASTPVKITEDML